MCKIQAQEDEVFLPVQELREGKFSDLILDISIAIGTDANSYSFHVFKSHAGTPLTCKQSWSTALQWTRTQELHR